MTLRLVNPEKEVVEGAHDQDTFPFDDKDSTNVEDPLAIKADKSEMKTVDDVEQGRRLRSHSKKNSTKILKIIKVECKPKGIRKSGTGIRPQRKRKCLTFEEKRKAHEYLRLRRLKMSAEEREKEARKKKERTQRRKARMTKEEREEYLQKEKERYRRRKAEMTEEERAESRQKQNEKRRRRIADMTEEERKVLRQKQRESARERTARIKEAAEKLKMKTNHSNADPDQEILKEDLNEYEAFLKRRREYVRRRRMENYEEEKNKVREYMKRLRVETPEKFKKYRDKINEWKRKKRLAKKNSGEGYAYKEVKHTKHRDFLANHETNEQRQRRLRKLRIYKAIRKLRKQLKEMEVPPGKVERRVTELKKTMEAEPLPPQETLSKYKPRKMSKVNSPIPPGQIEGKTKGKEEPPDSGSSRKIDANSEASGICATEIDNSKDFNDNANEQVQIDANHGIITVPELVPSNSAYSGRSDLISHLRIIIVLSSNDLKELTNTSHSQIPLGSTHVTTASKETSAKKERTFTCMKCDPTKSPHFECVKDLMTHVESTHPHSFYPCLKCNILKYTKCALKVHEKLCRFATNN